ncbi:MAG: peptidylprolyl isomerase [Burkholderiales bacterium]
MTRILREPLVQFLLVGVALFGAWHIVGPAQAARDSANRIVITEDDLKQIAVVWVSQGRPPPTPQQMLSMVEGRVREEVLYREALALGLDKDDAIVRRQLARKMEFVAEDLSKLTEPSPADLRAWYDRNKARFALPARATFRHLYFSPDRRGTRVRDDAVAALAQLQGQAIEAKAVAGDPFMLQGFYGDRSLEVVAKEFGPPFARALSGVKPGTWAGPIESGYGWHLVFVDAMTAQRIPAFDEVEGEVKTAWIEDNRERTKTQLYESMRARYEVVLPITR